MLLRVPPFTVIRIPMEYGSFGYGAKYDGDTLVIPLNPAVFKAIELSGVKISKMVVSTISRVEFNDLPEYGEDEDGE